MGVVRTLACAALIVGGSTLFFCCTASTDPARQLESDIRKRLPQGSAATEVARFLDDRRIEHSEVRNGVMTAIAREGTGAGMRVERSIQFTFFFAPNGRLIRYELRDVFTGP